MRMAPASCLVFFASASAFAQIDSEGYEQYRKELSYPEYGIAKVQKLVTELQASPAFAPLDAVRYAKLSIPEKFTYCMIYGEDSHQVCMMMNPPRDQHLNIFAYPPPPFWELRIGQTWSARQTEFLQINRKAVIELMRDTVAKTRRAGTNIKHAIWLLKAVELFPQLIELYNSDGKDHDLLTTLMLVMQARDYKPFESSPQFNELYGKRALYGGALAANSENKSKIIALATRCFTEFDRDRRKQR